MKTQKKSARAAWLRRGVLILLLIAAAGLGWRHLPRQAAPEIQPTPAPTQQTVDERDVREQAYDKDVQALQALVDNENADEQIRANAAEQLQKHLGLATLGMMPVQEGNERSVKRVGKGAKA